MNATTFSNGSIKIELIEGIAVIIIDRPPVNVLNLALLEEFKSKLEWCKGNLNVKVVLITGSGNVAFSVGADLTELATMGYQSLEGFSKTLNETLDLICSFAQPVICCVNGVAVGNGCEIAMACDIRIMNSSATFIFPEIELGVISSGGAIQRLAKLSRMGSAMYYLLSGEKIDAQAALRLGLVEKVVEQGAFEFGLELSRKITQGPQRVIRKIKALLKDTAEKPLTETLKLGVAASLETLESEEASEGISAFLEKRAPRFKS